jgi:hypothetical protein
VIRKKLKKKFYAIPLLPKIEIFTIFYELSTGTKCAEKRRKKIQKNDFCSIYPGHKSEILGGKKYQKN